LIWPYGGTRGRVTLRDVQAPSPRVLLLAVFLQAGTYGLTFLLPDLFATFGGE